LPDESIKNRWDGPFTRQATVEDIYYCFRLLLGRPPNPEEWLGHSSRVGEDLGSVVASYVTSLEFARRQLDRRNLLADLTLCSLDGFSLYATPNDLDVGKHIALGGSYEPGVTAIFRRLLKPGMGVLDVGANIGYFSMLAASLVGPKGHVLAVEPNPQNMKLLEASRRANGFSQVTTALCAAARATGLLMLNASHSNGTTYALFDELDAMLSAQTVPAFRLDDLVGAERPVDFLKIDVEGAEYNALDGFRAGLARCHPLIVSEFSPDFMKGISGVAGEDYLRLLIAAGYALSVIHQDGSTEDCGGDGAAVMAAYARHGADHIDILAQ